MDITHVASLVGSVVVVVGLLRAHRLVVERHTLPNMDFETEPEEEDDSAWSKIRK